MIGTMSGENWTPYFAYGSNLSLRQFAARCPGHRIVGSATVRGYRLVFPRYAGDWKSAVAGMERAELQHVEGAVYEVTAAHLRTLDDYEGVVDRCYVRGQVIAELAGGRRVEALTYFATPQEGAHRPHPRYVQTMLEGARDHALSAAWLAMLEQLLTAPSA
jgi:gamma-glutamylcyclotransferase (GGCT)/AIG2-like uncharacterized protein YtfP